MGKVFAFHGGIHPPENKHQSTQCPIAIAPLAKVLNVPVQQHIGAPAKVCVNIGDKVLKGQRIADAQGKVSVPIHAPSSGIIKAIAEHPVPHPSGMPALCISIETDGLDEWIEHSGLEDFRTLSKHQLIDYIRDRGIAGMGGAGFPTAVKLHLGDDHIVNTLIINAAECEPYISADDLLMRERASQIVSGIDVLQHLLAPSHIIIGIEDNKPQAIRALEIAIQDCKYNIDVVGVPTKYPSGGEKQLIQLLTNVEVPNGGIPADVGIVCQNVGTVYAIHQAVKHGESLISRVVTVTGDGVAKPQNYQTLIGTPFSLLLEAAGMYTQKTSRLIVGGPMMGFSIDKLDTPVVKTSNCIIAATSTEMPAPEPAQACIRCGLCEQVCPVQLLPQQLHWFAKGQEYQKAQQHNLFDCIECGACSYVCPSNIPLVQYYRHAKTSIREEQQDKRKSDLARERFEAKQDREQRAVDEKAAKRKARAEQAAKAQAEKKAIEKAPVLTPQVQLISLQNALKAANSTVLIAQQKLTDQTAQGNSATLDLCNLQLQKAQKQLEQAQLALDAFESKNETPAVDTKKLKIAAAQANTKLLKAKQALKGAIEKSQPGIELLESTISQLESEAASATTMYLAATQESTTIEKAAVTSEAELAATTPIAPAIKASNDSKDCKKLKIAAAILRAKLKKSQTQLALLGEQPPTQPDYQKLEEEITSLQQKLVTAEQEYQHSVALQPELNSTVPVKPALKSIPEQSAAAIIVDNKKLKTIAAIARTKAKKAQNELDKLIESGQQDSLVAKQLIEDLTRLNEKVLSTQNTYQTAKGPTTNAPEDENEQLQANFAKAQNLYDKASAALIKAQADNSPAVEKMETSIAKLKSRVDSAHNALTASSSNNQE
ncbi:MAG: electron transport complex subunit RsxC [Oceanospirillaceae bacterium]